MGNGASRFDAAKKRYFFDLAVTAQYNASAVADVDRWRRAFEHASEILFAATNGQMQLGELYFLDNGSLATEDDIVLMETTGGSFTTHQSAPLAGSVTLREHVRRHPTVIVHELGHYLATLGDEYTNWPLERQCQGNPALHQCIMEFARGFGIVLDLNGDPDVLQPQNIVNQFCYLNHVKGISNQQEFRNEQSCWETLQKIYENLVLPDCSSSPGTVEALQWIVRTPMSSYVFAIASDESFKVAAIDRAAKNATKEWVHRQALAGDQLALTVGALGTIRKMGPVDPEDAKPLMQQIDGLRLADGNQSQWNAQSLTQLFPLAPSAYHRLMLLASAHSSIDLKSLANQLAEKRIGLHVVTYGVGPLEKELENLQASSKWITHQNIPIAAQELGRYAFTLQNTLIERYFASTPGYGFVGFRSGCLPAIDKAAFARLPKELNSRDEDGQLEIDLQQTAFGVDFPIYVEEGAQSVTILLSEHEVGGIELSVLAPNEKEFQQPSDDSTQPRSVVSFDVREPVSGRWIVRLRRKIIGAKLPYFVMSAVKNRRIGFVTSIKAIAAKVVTFRLECVYDFPLDFVYASVEVSQLAPDGETSLMVKTILLRRERAFDPRTQQMVELASGAYEGESQFEPGSYIAVFRGSNSGQTIYASNPAGVVGGETVAFEQRQIPPFTRIDKHRFHVPD